MVCSFCGSEIKDGDKFCMVCGTAVEAMNNAAATPIDMPEVKGPDIPEVTFGTPDTSVTPEEPAGAYFSDQQSGPAAGPVPEPVYAAPQPDAQPMYGQPAYAQPTPSQPVYGQPVYAQPAPGQPVYGQPVYAQPQPMPVMDGQPVYAQPAPGQQPMYGQPVPPQGGVVMNSTPNLVFGIVSLCLSITFWLSIPGIVLGAIGLSKSNETLSTYGMLDNKGKVGRHLSRAGLITGIVMAVFFVIVILAYMAEEVW